jgi:heme-degrading monooxygenase HmoA
MVTGVIICQFIFKPGKYDEDFHRLDGQIDAFARSLPGFRATETWQSADGTVVNATYYFDDMASVRQLSQFPQHLEAKGQYQRWYDGYRIVISEVAASYGDDRLPHVTRADT